jgi:DNA-binding IscR family transcriptional regulator
VRVGDVVRAVEGPIAIADPREDDASGDLTSRSVLDEAFDELSRNVEACFDDFTMEDLCARGEESGRRRKPPRRYVYVI